MGEINKTRWLRVWLLLAALLLLQGCSNEYAEQTQLSVAHLQTKIEQLGTQLDGGQLTNALLVKGYASKLERSQPDLAPVARALTKDASTQGNLYLGLTQRLSAINRSPANKDEYLLGMEDIHSLDAATDPAIFNDALLDLVNTLADLSGGELARVNIPKDADAQQVKGGGVVPGSYLVGNPSYGQWTQDSAGGSFWQFYGQYRMFTDLLGGSRYNRGPIGYDDWNSRPNYSYHRDYGRDLYGSRTERASTAARDKQMQSKGVAPAKPKLKYGSAAGQQRNTTYSTARKEYSQAASKKYGASGGPRHSTAFGSSTKPTTAKSAAAAKAPTQKRTSNLFGASSRSSSRSSGGVGGRGGK